MPVTLADIATIEQRQENTSGYARTNGQPSLTLSVSLASGANTVAVSREIEAVFEAAREDYAGEIVIETILDQADFITESVDGLLQEGLLGGLFAILVIFVFLRSVRTTLVAAISIPLSLFIAIATFGLFGLTINILTLSGLTVAVGRVVDDSIVVLENIYRHKGLGDATGDAVINGTREVASAITASTVTTVAVFLPIGFVGGLVSQFFLPFGLAVTFALLASLVVALTVIPVLAYLFIDKVHITLGADGELPETVWQRLYTPVLALALRGRTTKWATLGIAFVLSAVALVLAGSLPTAFIDMGGENIVQVTVSPPQGGSTSGVRERTIAAEEILLANEDVELVMSTVPGDTDTGTQALQSAFAGRAPNSSLITARLADGTDLDVAREAIKADLAPLERDGFDIAVAQQDAISAGSGLSIVVSGQDPAEIKAASDTIVLALARHGGHRQRRQRRCGGGTAGIGRGRSQHGHDDRLDHGTDRHRDPQRAGRPEHRQLHARGRRRPRYAAARLGRRRSTPWRPCGRCRSAVRSAAGRWGSWPTSRSWMCVARSRASTARRPPPSAPTSPSRTPAAVSEEAAARIDDLRAAGALSESVETTFAGTTAEMNEAFSSLFLSMGFAILVVYIVMVLALGSLITPFIIMFSLPLAAIGAIPALLISGHPLGISAMVGFLMLIGIVVTNAIVLLDFVEQLRAKGRSTQEALMGGGRVRVRPILMTAVATILALTPVAMGMAHGSVIAEELAVVVIGGLFTSTFLTLIVVPVLYSLVDGGKAAFEERFGAGTTDGVAQDAAAEVAR